MTIIQRIFTVILNIAVKPINFLHKPRFLFPTIVRSIVEKKHARRIKGKNFSANLQNDEHERAE